MKNFDLSLYLEVNLFAKNRMNGSNFEFFNVVDSNSLSDAMCSILSDILGIDEQTFREEYYEDFLIPVPAGSTFGFKLTLVDNLLTVDYEDESEEYDVYDTDTLCYIISNIIENSMIRPEED